MSIVFQFASAPAQAATGFQQAYIRLDRMKINTTTGGLVCATPASTATERYLVITFPSTYTLHETESRWGVNTTNLPTGATAWPGIATPTLADNTAKTVTFDFNSGGGNNINVGTMYCFNFTNDGSNPDPLTTATVAANNQQANIETQTTTPTQVDYTELALANIADDQILVTAVVPPTFVFSLSGNAADFNGNLSPTAVSSSDPITATITTNAKSGWIAWAKDTDRGGGPNAQGIRSSTAGYTIATSGTLDNAPTDLNFGTEGYVLDVDTVDAGGGCTAATTAEYNGTTVEEGGTFSRFFQPISACTGGSPGTASGDTFTLIERIAISGATPAATDYSDVITVVAAGNF